ncbi:MAG: putative metal-binding motif-containing protein [Deltaproteobacteria bacterium]|nr:putative metal-binding motif-containing protein [Deltaproteobacteria bacterium]
MRTFAPALALLFVLPGVASAQDLEPSPLPPLDPDRVAHVVLEDEGTAPSARWYAIDGRFAGDLDGDGTDDFVLPGATDNVLHVVLGSTSLDPTTQVRRGGEGDSTITLPEGCRDGDDRIRWAALGDINGDDRVDLGVACLLWDELVDSTPHLGAAAIYLGRGSWPPTVTTPDTVILGDPVVLAGEPPLPAEGTRPGADIARIGDLDGDGRDEFLLSGFDIEDPFRPTAWILPGSADVTSLDSVGDATWRIRGEPGAECTAPLFLAGIGDPDGDGIPDLGVSCVVQPSAATVNIDFSIWFGGDLVQLPDGDIDFSTRSITLRPSEMLVPYPSALSRIGDLDGDGYDEFSITSWIDGLSQVSGRLVKGHAGPWQDIGFFDAYWLEEFGTIDPYPGWLPTGTYDAPEGLQMAPAGDLGGDTVGDLWVRVGTNDTSRVGLLTSPSPSTWLDGSVPPFVLTVGPPGGTLVDDDLRFGLGGSGDANGDGVPDLLVTSGFADDAGCTADLCGGAYLLLCVDSDGDGVGVCAGDCDDADDTVLPGALEVCDDLDHDCDGNDGSVDGDGDGSLVCDGDCDDNDPERFPGAEETCEADRDLDCDGLIPGEDQDGDGALNCDDCQPFLAAMAPGNVESCDGLDNNCDGVLPREEQDVDQDGVPACSVAGAPGDCDDNNALVRPGRFEDCFNAVDDNCDGAIDIDVDADGDGLATCDGDCDDSNAIIFPGSTEVCDGLDNNCNGVVDDARDDDGDGFGACDGDCDDRDPLRFPGNVGQCDPDRDADCSGTSDIADADGDGFSACSGDCAEGDPGISPGVPDWCDGLDNDCDGVVDAPFDVDVDGWATCAGDCRDDAVLTFPQVTEPICDDVRDGDCDGLFDEEDPDCDEEATPPPPEPRPYGLSCTSSLGAASAAPWCGAVVLLLFGLRRRRVWADVRGIAGLLLLLLLLPLPAEAAKKEPTLFLYLYDRPDVGAMQEAKAAAPKLDAAEILHSSELLPPAKGLTALGAKRVQSCEGSAPNLATATTSALDALIELDYGRTVRLVDGAIKGLPCVERELPPRLLANLFYYRGLAKAALNRADADADFAQVVALDPKHRADQSFDPVANARLEKARGASEGSEVTLSAFVLPGGRLRVDGQDVEPGVSSRDVRPGLHVAQIRAGRTTRTLVFEVMPETPVVVVGANDRVRALRDAALSEGARAYAMAELGDAAVTAETDLVALVDLDVQTEPLRYLYRVSTERFSFDADWGAGVAKGVTRSTGAGRTTKARNTSGDTPQGGSLTVSSSGGSKGGRGGGSARAGGAGTSVAASSTDSVLRLRVSGGFAFTRPFPYVQIPVDVGIRLVKGLHLDVQIAVANPGSLEEGGPVWLPTVALGASYRFQVPVLEPRVGAAFQIGLDDSTGPIGPLPGWYGVAGFDLLPPGTPLLIGFDVRAGMLGKPFFIGVSAGIGVAL